MKHFATTFILGLAMLPCSLKAAEEIDISAKVIEKFVGGRPGYFPHWDAENQSAMLSFFADWVNYSANFGDGLEAAHSSGVQILSPALLGNCQLEGLEGKLTGPGNKKYSFYLNVMVHGSDCQEWLAKTAHESLDLKIEEIYGINSDQTFHNVHIHTVNWPPSL